MESKKNKPSWEIFLDGVHSGGGQWLNSFYHYGGACTAYLASRLGLKPNHLTFISCGLIILSMVLAVGMPGYGWMKAISVSSLLALSFVIDCADGQLARATNQTSKLGAWLDHLVDAWKVFIVNFSIGWLLLSESMIFEISTPVAFLAMALNISGSAIYFFAWNYKTMIAGKDLITKMTSKDTQKRHKIFRLAHEITDYAWIPFMYLLLAIPEKFATVYLYYGIVTFFIFMGYLIMSGNYMRKIKD